MREMTARMTEQALGSPLVYLVPEQATFQAEQALVQRSTTGGLLRAQALSFRRLAYRILQETGGYARVQIGETGQRLHLYQLLEQQKSALTRYRSSSNKPGFLDKVLELFTEWKRYGITPDSLSAEVERISEQSSMAQELRGKLDELLPVYRAYEETLASSYIDSEDLLQLFAAQAGESAWLKTADIWIDGFHGFTPLEYRVLGELMRVCPSVTIALTLDRVYEAGEKPSELELFHPTAVTCGKLMALCAEQGVRVEVETLDAGTVPRFAAAEPLALIERGYTKRRAVETTAALEAHLAVHAAPNRRVEMEHVAAQMVRLVRDQGYRWRDLAVLMRKPDGYVDVIEHVFDAFGIPYFLDAKKGVMEQPLIEFIRSGLEIIQKDWTYDAVFRCLKTDLLNPLITDGDKAEARRRIDELENYVLAFGIKGSMWTSEKPWTYRVWRSIEDEDPGANEREQATLDRMNDIRARIVAPFRALKAALAESTSVKQIAEAIYAWLEAAQVPQQLAAWAETKIAAGQLREAKDLSRLWAEVLEWFDQLVDVLGNQPISLEEVDRLLEAGLSGMKLGAVPPSLDQVVIGSMERTRFGGIKQAFVIGVNDGVFPSKFNEDSLLSETERMMLADAGVELAPDARRKLLDEQFMVYQALTVASDKLWVSYAMAAEDGASLLPSEIVRRLQLLFPTLRVETLVAAPSAETPRATQLAALARPSQALSHFVVQLRKWRNGDAIHPIWWQAYQWLVQHPDWQLSMRRVTANLFYRNIAKPLSTETTSLLYGTTLTTSVSKMEMFNACAFQYFSANGLKLKERSIYKLDTPDIGNLFHAALSHVAKQLLAEGRSWGSLTAGECRQLAEMAVELFGPRLQNEILLSSDRYQYIASKFKAVLERTLYVMSEHGRRGEFVPVGLELGFGRGGELPALPIVLPNGGKMDIIGRIDRVDKAELNGDLLLRVVDYKSSSKKLELHKMYYGLQLQLLTYLDVAVTHAEQWLGRKAKPAGMLYMHVHNPMLARTNGLEEASLAREVFKSYKMMGFVSDDLDIVKLMDNTMAPSVTSEILNVKLKKDGNWASASNNMSDVQLDLARQFVRHKIEQVGSAVLGGDVSISPYQMKKAKPCTYCSYKEVCQIDGNSADTPIRQLYPMKEEQTWQAIEATLAKGGRQ
jgi:ATP-dependent helicase/nuclease subunit B